MSDWTIDEPCAGEDDARARCEWWNGLAENTRNGMSSRQIRADLSAALTLIGEVRAERERWRERAREIGGLDCDAARTVMSIHEMWPKALDFLAEIAGSEVTDAEP